MDIFAKIPKNTNVRLLAQCRAAGASPYFHTLYSQQDTIVNMEGRRTIMLGSNNYLGLTNHPEVKAAGMEAIERYGSGCSGSRFLNGTLELHVQLEEEIAAFLRKDAAMTFGTGFQANLGILSALAGLGDIIFCDKENHASIYDGCRLSFAKMVRYAHSDMEDLERRLASAPAEAGKLIVTDGVFSMSGDICKLPEIVALAKKYGARIMVDDAHGLGVLGATGRGTAEYFGLEGEVDVLMGTFSKSLASIGGYMAARADVVEFARLNSRPFIFSASMTPAAAACARAALAILKREPERVQRLLNVSAHMRGKLKANGVPIIESLTPIIPIYTYENEKTFRACRMLFERGVYVNPVIAPAAPEGQCLIRTSYTATHEEKTLDEAAEKITEVLAQLNNED